MNSITKKTTTLGLAALTLAGAASANPFGFLASSEPKAPPASEPIGLLDLEQEDFPKFGNFSWGAGDHRFTASFAFVFRTQSHIENHAKGPVKAEKGSGIDPSKKLGHYDDQAGPFAHAPLVSTIITDHRDLGVSFSGVESLGSLISSIEARMETENTRGFVLAVRSTGGSRIRPIYLYQAARKTIEGQKYLVCRFYDPHAQRAVTKESGRKISVVTGHPDLPGSQDGVAFHELRIPFSGSTSILVAKSWASTFEGASFAGQGGDWREIERGNLRLVHFNGWDAWVSSGWDRLRAIFSSNHAINARLSEVRTTGKVKDLIQSEAFQFGAFDRADLESRAPALD